MDPLKELADMAEAKGGNFTVHELQNEQGETVHSFATMSLPLRKDHWIYQKGDDGFGFPPPMPLRMGAKYVARFGICEKPEDPSFRPVIQYKLDRRQLAEMIRAAGKYAVRAATMHGSEMDFDPDAMLQNLVVGFLGYWTATGLGGESFEDPKEPWTPPDPPQDAPGGPVATNAAPQI